MKDLSRSRDLSLTASGESAGDNPVAVSGGEIFWRGVYRPRDSAIRLRDEFASYTDWADAQQYAADLTEALRMTERVDA